MKKAGPDRKYTVEFRTAAVSQVIDGKHGIADVAAALDVPKGTLGKWAARAHAGLAPTMQTPSPPVTGLALLDTGAVVRCGSARE